MAVRRCEGNVGASIRRHPLIILLLAALFVRAVLASLFTTDYDNTYWAYVISNIDSGNGLYGLIGYCYAPVWGYILAFLGEFINHITNIVMLGGNFPDLLPIGDVLFSQHLATVTTVGFNLVMKTPLILSDLAVGYLIYVVMMDRFNDRRKALIAMSLWLFCPVTIYMSSIGVQFDTMSALLLMLTIYYVRRGRWLLTGLFFGIAALLKFFPLFGGLVLLAYIYVRTRDDEHHWQPFVQCLGAFAITVLLLMAPVICCGDLSDSIAFMTGRSGSTSMLFASLIVTLVLAVQVVATVTMLQSSKEEADDLLFLSLTLTIAAPLVLVMTPQYLIVLLPLWCMEIFLCPSVSGIALVAAVGGSLVNSLLTQSVSVMVSAAKQFGIFSVDFIRGTMEWLSLDVMGRSIGEWGYYLGERIERIGILLLILLCIVQLLHYWYCRISSSNCADSDCDES